MTASCARITFNGHGFLPRAVTETRVWSLEFPDLVTPWADAAQPRSGVPMNAAETKPSRMLSLDSLPAEIISHICCNLCVHCRRSYVLDISPEEAYQAHEEQQALSRLSRTSKRLRLTAQRILFHYFYSQTYPVLDDDCVRGPSAPRRNSAVREFLRTVIERADLAKSVRALFFFEVRNPETRLSLQDQTLFRHAGERVGFQNLASYDSVQAKWLQEVTVMMTPFLEQLLVHRSSLEGFPFLRDSPSRLPNLKHLVLPGRRSEVDSSCHIQEMRDLFIKTPNLKTLAASDCDNGSDLPTRERWRMEAWTTPFANLCKLSLHGLDPENVAKILRFCPALEELEYFCDLGKYTMLQPHHLEPVRDRLRRICYTGLAWENANASPQEVANFMADVMAWDSNLRADFSFGNFPVLEVLEVEQMLLYGPVFAFDTHERKMRFESLREVGPELFMATLPGSLQILRIGVVIAWQELYRDLLGMSGKLYRFSSLRIVAVDLHGFEFAHEKEVQNLTDAFAAQGVVFELRRMAEVPFSKGMMGPRPGHTDLWNSKALMFSLEGRY